MNLRVVFMVGVVLFSGCSGLAGSGDGTQTPTKVVTNNPPQTVTTPTAKSHNLSEQEREYLESGNEFGRLIEANIHRHEHTFLRTYEAYPNNTVELTIRTDGEVPLERSIMDGAQISAAMTHVATSVNETWADQNTSEAPYYQPDQIIVYIHGPNAELLGTYEINPAKARDYRQANITPGEFAEGVMDSYQPRQDFERGGGQVSSYLTGSEYAIWIEDYQEEVKDWAENSSFQQPFPLDNIQVNESSGEILHEITWDRDDFTQYFGSASATVFTGYWRTTDNSIAMAPNRLNLYIKLPENDQNYAGYMNRDAVWWFLTTDRENEARVEYLDQEEFWFVDNNENPFEDDF